MADFLHLCCVWNDRMHLWIEVASSFDRGKVVDLAAYIALADVFVEVATSATDSNESIAAAVSALLPPKGSFAEGMSRAEDALVAKGSFTGSCVSPRRRRADA